MGWADAYDQLLEALGAWQNGWREVQSRREDIGQMLVESAADLPLEFKTVSSACYRKRFIHKGETVDIFLGNCKDEGIASWTLDLRFAERLKGLTRVDAVTAAIFEHVPAEGEVVVSFPALWNSQTFREAVEDYAARDAPYAKALMNFRDAQQEIVLVTPLRSSELIALTGVSSPFDEICDKAGIPEQARDAHFKALVDNGTYVGEVQYIDREATQRVVTRSIQHLYKVVNEYLERQGYLPQSK